MFEVAREFLIDMAPLLPGIIALYILFDLVGALLFGKK